ncbi:MAG: hypothetical protein LUE17_16740, partial [Planctomycetaceae bacterium]|nr:hypothetical protein [Planctomycetaceae bacterium]
MAKSREFPTPKKRFHKNAWELYWNWGNARFVIHPGIIGHEKEGTAEFELRRLATILASQNPDFPDEWAHLPAVRRYIGARYGVEAPEDEPKADLSVHRWLVDYEPNLLASVGEDWAATSMSVLRRLQAFIPGGLGKVTHGLAIQYLDSLVE